ncbi:MAG: TolC family protein [Deltaproteobacteria bacterium]|nr:TolC family protein [Deltaproteobacteria bacterium]
MKGGTGAAPGSALAERGGGDPGRSVRKGAFPVNSRLQRRGDRVVAGGRTKVSHVAAAIALLACFATRSAHAQARDALPTPLDVQAVVRYVEAHRAEIVAALAEARALAQRPTIVGTLPDPMVMVSADHIPFSGMGVDGSIQVQQDFPLSGVLGARRRAAQAAADARRLQAGETMLDLTGQALQAFHMLAGTRRMATVLDAQVALAADLTRIATARYAAGAAPQSDVLRADTETRRQSARRAALRGETVAREAMLNAALGRAGDLPMPELAAASDEPPAPIEALVAESLRGRPELASVEATRRRYRSEVEAMRGMYWPMAFVRAGASTTMSDGPGVMVMVGVSVPIWRARLAAGVQEARAMGTMADAELRGARTMIEGEVRSAHGTLEAARVRTISLRDEVQPLAVQTLQATIAAYSAGQTPLVAVIEAAVSLRMTLEEQVMAEVEVGVARARLERAVGRFTEGRR